MGVLGIVGKKRDTANHFMDLRDANTSKNMKMHNVGKLADQKLQCVVPCVYVIAKTICLLILNSEACDFIQEDKT